MIIDDGKTVVVIIGLDLSHEGGKRVQGQWQTLMKIFLALGCVPDIDPGDSEWWHPKFRMVMAQRLGRWNCTLVHPGRREIETDRRTTHSQFHLSAIISLVEYNPRSLPKINKEYY